MDSPDGGPAVLADLRAPVADEGMDDVHAALARCWSALGPALGLPPRWRDEFALAAAEVAANIIQHAPAPDRPADEFAFALVRHPDRLVARFVDRGAVAMPATAVAMPSVEGPVDDLGERGRGLALVQATTDLFEYRRTPAGENVWTIGKNFPAG